MTTASCAAGALYADGRAELTLRVLCGAKDAAEALISRFDIV
jgi:hypothetical protein